MHGEHSFPNNLHYYSLSNFRLDLFRREAIMNNDTKGGCLAIVLGGILFILGPIVVILYGLISAPIGMKVFLLAWMLFVILCNTFISDKSTRIALSIIPTVIYAFSFAAWYANDAVSYTHLDVYKRQSLLCSNKQKPSFRWICMIC